MQSITIDDIALPVRRPESVAELCVLVHQAAASGQGVYPVGGGTTLGVGLPPGKPGFALDTTALNQVIDYPARDMTITVQAGITLAKLQETLAAEGQWLPIDVPHPDRATLGGAMALNLSGPRRFGYGTFRDYVIGISFVTDEGDEVKAGGRVVKNVAGYDLMKLQVGAVGTLGVITQVTLKVKPKPEAAAVIRMHCAAAALPEVLEGLHATRTRPTVVDIATERSAAGAAWSIVVVFEEKAETVEWQVRTLLEELKASPVSEVRADRQPGVASLPARRYEGESRLTLKANVRPSTTATFANLAEANPALHVHAHAMNGIVYASAVAEFDLERSDAIARSLGDSASECGGNLTVPCCPPSWKKALPVWGRPIPDRDLMRHIKRTLDPKNVFNPGRLFDAL